MQSDAQVLQRARTSAGSGKLLTSEASHGPYGDGFWKHVASRVPGRTAGQCLDAYLSAHSSPVARFSATESRLSVAKQQPGGRRPSLQGA